MISTETPLLSNLDVVENIALIKEVHEMMSVKDAENLASNYLEKVGFFDILRKRPSSCSSLEKFYVKIIRAYMMDTSEIIVVRPFSMVDSMMNINEVITNIKKLDIEKKVTIMDLINNETLYKGDLWNIIK